MSSVISTEDLGQSFHLDTIRGDDGGIYYRICTRGSCRYVEDLWMAMMYAESMGWLPPSQSTH
jgi:hypothetical protein